MTKLTNYFFDGEDGAWTDWLWLASVPVVGVVALVAVISGM